MVATAVAQRSSAPSVMPASGPSTPRRSDGLDQDPWGGAPGTVGAA
jgi:hypothetical protein